MILFLKKLHGNGNFLQYSTTWKRVLKAARHLGFAKCAAYWSFYKGILLIGKNYLFAFLTKMAWHHLVSIHTSPKENRGVLPEIIKEEYYFLVFKTVEELSSHMCQDEKSSLWKYVWWVVVRTIWMKLYKNASYSSISSASLQKKKKQTFVAEA